MTKFLSFVILSVVVNSTLAAVPLWGQCGGRNYNGDTTCVSGATCTFLNDWYHQCLPGTAAPTTTQAPPTTIVTPTTTNPGGPTTTTSPPPASGTGLHARIVSKGKLYWGSCADSALLNKAANAAILRSDFGQLTAENSMKWDALQPSRGTFNWGNADTLVNWATANGKMIRGHTLVWHSQLPNWVNNVNDAATLTTVINDHIRNVAGRWAGKIYAWDVVNEILNEDGSLRSSVFSRVLGESFVAIAFRAARAADPNAKLYINDYNLDYDNAKTRGTVNLVKRVNGQGTQLIDGLGTQMHLEAGGVSGVLAALNALASAGSGLEVAITELDIKGASANDYTTVLRACLQVSQCVGITSWGVSDADSWRSQNSPLLFNTNYQPKAAYNALIQALA